MVSITWKKHDLVGDIVKKLVYYSSIFLVFFLGATSNCLLVLHNPKISY